MNRATKLKFNTITSLLYQILSIVSGFILPRLILQNYGSDINGVVSSITQFLAIISLCECGVGAVVQSALYKPLAEKNVDELSKIYVSSNNFFRKVAAILAMYIVVLIVVFPHINDGGFDFAFTATLIISISIGTMAQYYFGITNQLVLNASQLIYMQMLMRIVCLIINVVLSIFLMNNGASIQVVKLTSSLIFLIQPVFYAIIVKRKYVINKKITYTDEPIKQKWNGMAQHVATVVFENTSVLVLTVLSTLENVSVYSVYHMVTNGLKLFFVAMTSAMKPYLGDLYARNEIDKLNKDFGKFEWLMHTCSTLIFTVAGILIVPFVKVYTLGITDAEYIQPLFGFFLCLSMAIYTIRLPYSYMILSAGHFKQTQTSAIIEATLNIIISVVFVWKFDLIGVGIAATVAMIYRTVYFVRYLSRDILNRDVKIFLKHIFVDAISSIIMVLSTLWIDMTSTTYFGWILMACLVGVICVIEVVVINTIFFKDRIKSLINDRRLKHE